MDVDKKEGVAHSMKPKKIGLVGFGKWGRNLARNFHALGALGAVCDLNPAQLEQAKNQYPGVKCTALYKELLSDPGVDAVVVATVAGLHHQIAREALLAGKDVFVEKPFVLRWEDGVELVELAKNLNRILMVGHLLRYHPAVLRLKSLIAEGVLGKICYVYSNRLNLGQFRTEENILWSFAPHDLSAILYLLGESPVRVSAQGGSYLNREIPDVTTTTLEFQSGVRGHIFVSWLHPFKEQKLVVVGDKGMAVFNDVEPENKLVLLKHHVDWIGRSPIASKEPYETVDLTREEPLKTECAHFLECLASRLQPQTDGREALRVLEVLEAAQKSLDSHRAMPLTHSSAAKQSFMAHETAVVDDPACIGAGTRVWHFSHIMKDAAVGENCVIGQNVFIGANAVVGDRCKIQNNVMIFDGVVLGEDVFCGPSVVFTNVLRPRGPISRKHEFSKTIVGKGATVGANATVICGVEIGEYSFVGAGAVVTKNVPAYALVFGNPARVRGWVCRCGYRLEFKGRSKVESAVCRECALKYRKDKKGRIQTEGQNGH